MKTDFKRNITLYRVYWSCLFLIICMSGSCSKTNSEEGVEKEEEIENVINEETEYAILLKNDYTSEVSDKLLGFNVIYPHEKDAIWADGQIAEYLKNVNVGFIRYPGGTVCSFYHWNALTGEGWADGWDPENQDPPNASSEFMDIDEYINLVRITGATPLIGINVSSGWRWDREEDGIKEALDLMQYCRDKNFNVEYWYLDNEPYQHDSNGGAKSPEIYATLLNTYAQQMKAFDPDIKIVANWKAYFSDKRPEYQKLIQLAGANIDVIDIHWYWSWNDLSWEKWLSKTPMEQWTGFSYAQDIAYFRQMVKDMGYPDIKLASFEWNLGPIRSGSNYTASKAALTQAEMLLQYIQGGLDFAVFWPIHWPGNSSIDIRSFVIPSSGNLANPNYELFQFIGKLQGGKLGQIEISQPAQHLVPVAVANVETDTLRVCVLNKNSSRIISEVNIAEFPGFELKNAQEYEVTDNGYSYRLGDVERLQSEDANVVKWVSKSFSLTMLTFGKT